MAIAAKLDMAGIMILPTDTSSTSGPTPPSGGYSPATSTPQYLPYIAPTPGIPLPANTTTKFNNTYQWNPRGDGIMQEAFPFAIVTVTLAERDYLLALANTNEGNEAGGKFVYNTVEFYFYMYAQDSTVRCLDDATCMPLGGQSVWGSLGNLTFNSTDYTLPVNPDAVRPFVMLTTKMDAAGFFHQMSPGGDESMASIALVASVIKTLSNIPGINKLSSQLLFAFFQGESYSHIGSRKFVDDLLNFQCLDPNLEAIGPDDSVSANSANGAACNNPYKNSLVFQNVPFSKISKLVEIGQIGLNKTVFVHRQKDGNMDTDTLVQHIYDVAANLSTPLAVSPALDETPGIPPSCAEAFLDANPQLPTVVLTDHAGPYSNKFFQSQFDDAFNLISEPGASMLQHENLCNKATLVSRLLWIELGGSIDISKTISADCDLINSLLNCLLLNINCDLVLSSGASYGFSNPTPNFKPYPRYTSVYNLIPLSYIDGMPLFLYDLLNPYVLNATDYVPPPAGLDPSIPWSSPPVNMHYHDAVDPNIVFDQDANRWRIKPWANDRYLYTESNWDNGIGWRSYRVEDPKVEVIAFVVGIGVAIATILSVASLKEYCRKRFKQV